MVWFSVICHGVNYNDGMVLCFILCDSIMVQNPKNSLWTPDANCVFRFLYGIYCCMMKSVAVLFEISVGAAIVQTVRCNMML